MLVNALTALRENNKHMKARNKSKSTANTFIILLLSVLAVLWIVQYSIKNRLIPEGIYLYHLQNQADHLKVKNDILKEEILHHESLTTIEQEARQMGFIDHQRVFTIDYNQ